MVLFSFSSNFVLISGFKINGNAQSLSVCQIELFKSCLPNLCEFFVLRNFDNTISRCLKVHFDQEPKQNINTFFNSQTVVEINSFPVSRI